MVARLGSRTGVCSDRRVDLEAHHYSGRVGNMLLFQVFSMVRSENLWKIMGTIFKENPLDICLNSRELSGSFLSQNRIEQISQCQNVQELKIFGF